MDGIKSKCKKFGYNAINVNNNFAAPKSIDVNCVIEVYYSS